MDDVYIDDLLDSNEVIEFLDTEYEEPAHTETRYYQEEILTLGGFDVTMDDIFVKKPKLTVQKKEGFGYMLSRLMNQESLKLKQILYDCDISELPQYLTIGNFVEQLEYFISTYNECNDKKNKDKKSKETKYCLLGLWKLLTNTFITESTNEYNKKQSRIKNRKKLYFV